MALTRCARSALYAAPNQIRPDERLGEIARGANLHLQIVAIDLCGCGTAEATGKEVFHEHVPDLIGRRTRSINARLVPSCVPNRRPITDFPVGFERDLLVTRVASAHDPRGTNHVPFCVCYDEKFTADDCLRQLFSVPRQISASVIDRCTQANRLATILDSRVHGHAASRSAQQTEHKHQGTHRRHLGQTATDIIPFTCELGFCTISIT